MPMNTASRGLWGNALSFQFIVSLTVPCARACRNVVHTRGDDADEVRSPLGPVHRGADAARLQLREGTYCILLLLLEHSCLTSSYSVWTDVRETLSGRARGSRPTV